LDIIRLRAGGSVPHIIVTRGHSSCTDWTLHRVLLTPRSTQRGGADWHPTHGHVDSCVMKFSSLICLGARGTDGMLLHGQITMISWCQSTWSSAGPIRPIMGLSYAYAGRVTRLPWPSFLPRSYACSEFLFEYLESCTLLYLKKVFENITTTYSKAICITVTRVLRI